MGKFIVGKCPCGMSNAEAEAILNSGMGEYDPGDEHPKKIYAVHNGVVYIAMRNNDGNAYHGYPATRRDVVGSAYRYVLEMADRDQCMQAAKAWLKEHRGGNG
ncbi:MAG: hypothetical protein IT204_23215 [Fimbriimonadaceae bacterium]|nr:hypothetical protein [Fimbriimonadaceae bacterium]